MDMNDEDKKNKRKERNQAIKDYFYVFLFFGSLIFFAVFVTEVCGIDTGIGRDYGGRVD